MYNRSWQNLFKLRLTDKILYFEDILGPFATNEEVKKFRALLSQKTGIRRHIRIIGVGEEGVGKTTLCRRLLKQDFSDVQKTRGIETHIYAAEMDNTGCNIKERKKDGRLSILILFG